LMNLMMDCTQYSGVFTTIIFVVKTLIDLHRKEFKSKLLTQEVINKLLSLESDQPFDMNIAQDIELVLREPIIQAYFVNNPMELIGQFIFTSILQIAKYYEGVSAKSDESKALIEKKMHKMGSIMLQLTGMPRKQLSGDVLHKHKDSLLVVAVDLSKYMNPGEEKKNELQIQLENVASMANEGNFHEILVVLTHVGKFLEVVEKYPLDTYFPGIPDVHHEDGTTNVLEYFYGQIQSRISKDDMTLYRHYLLSLDVAEDYSSFNACVWEVQKLRLMKEQCRLEQGVKVVRNRSSVKRSS